MEIRYPATLIPQDGGYLVQFVDFEDTFTEGETVEAALFNASEVLSAMVGWKIDNGQPIPAPTTGLKKTRYIAPDAKTQAALLVRMTRGARPLSEIARTLETSWPAAKRLENPHHYPSLKQLEKAAAALGKRLVLSFE